MARRIYIVELEVEAEDKDETGHEVAYGTFLPDDDWLTEAVMKAMGAYTARRAEPWMVEAAEVIGKREG